MMTWTDLVIVEVSKGNFVIFWNVWVRTKGQVMKGPWFECCEGHLRLKGFWFLYFLFQLGTGKIQVTLICVLALCLQVMMFHCLTNLFVPTNG